jgi:hypothetical protein
LKSEHQNERARGRCSPQEITPRLTPGDTRDGGLRESERRRHAARAEAGDRLTLTRDAARLGSCIGTSIRFTLLRLEGPLFLTRYPSSQAFHMRDAFCALALLRRDVSNRGRELCMCYGINRPMPDPCARRVFAQKIVAPPVRRRSDRPGHEPAAAIGADVIENVLHTRCTEGAFVGANARFT